VFDPDVLVTSSSSPLFVYVLDKYKVTDNLLIAESNCVSLCE